MLFNRVILRIPIASAISRAAIIFPNQTRTRGNSINDRGERVIINHPFRPYYTRRDVKSKVIYELISALARMLTKRVSVCLSCSAERGGARSARAHVCVVTRLNTAEMRDIAGKRDVTIGIPA